MMRVASALLGLTLSSLLRAVAAADMPDLALLEFLGEFEDQSGEWLDPLALEAALDRAPPAKLKAAEKTEDQP